MRPIKDKFILLFTPQPTAEGRRMPPLGLLAISSLLDKEGYDIRIYHSYDKKDYLKALDYLDKAICVGITSMTGYQIYDGLEFAKLVREKNRQVPIIWGGIHPTIKPRQTIEHPLVDIVVKGPGEETFTELVHCLDRQESYENILGIVYKKTGQIMENQDRPVKKMADYPMLPYHLLDDFAERFIKKNEYASRSLSYITSWGCPFRCAFCYLANPTFERKWNCYPAKRVVEELEFLAKKYNLTGIDIRDSNFFVDLPRVKEICRGLIEKNIKIVLTGLNGRSDQLAGCGPEDWQLFKQAGMKELLIGAESGDQEMLNLINKQNLVENTLKCEITAKKYGINIINSFITSFPPQTESGRQIKAVLKRELNNTVELLRNIFLVNPAATVLLFFYTPYPGTPLYDLAVKMGFPDPQKFEDWSFVDLAHQVTPWTSQKHIKKVKLLRVLIVFKKIFSQEYLKKKSGGKAGLLRYSGLAAAVNFWVGLRFKYKFYFLPFERLLFIIIKTI